MTVEPDVLGDLPRGSVQGVVVDASGTRVRGHNYSVDAVGDIENYEPDGGVGIATSVDGTFNITKLAAMGWEISIRDPANGKVLGHAHVRVNGGQTTTVQITLTP